MFDLRIAGAWLRARIIDDWRAAWRFASVWLAAIGAVLEIIYQFAPPELYALLPFGRVIPLVLFVLVIAGRLVKQREARDDR